MAYCEKRLVPVQFGGGINTKADPKQLQAGELLTLVNGQFSKTGAINKRYGYSKLGMTVEGGGTIAAGVELATYKNELVLFDGTSVYSYVSATGNWANRGTAISIVTEDQPVIHTSQAQQLNPDMAYASGIEVYAWEDSRGGVRYSVFDTVTRAFVVTDTAVGIAGAQQPKLITFNGLIYLFYVVATNLYYQIIGPLNPSVIQPAVAVLTDGNPGFNWFPYDVSVTVDVNGTQLILVFYLSSVPKLTWKLFDIDRNGTVTAPTFIDQVNVPAAGVHGAANVIAVGNANVFTSFANGVNVTTGAIFNYAKGNTGANPTPVGSLVDTANVVTLAAVAGYTIQSQAAIRLFWEVTASPAYNEQVRYAEVTSAGPGAITTVRSVGLASKPWRFTDALNTRIFVNVAYQSTLQATDFTLYVPSSGSPVVVSKMTPSVGGGLQTLGMCPETVQISYGVYKLANLMAGKLTSEANTLFSLLGVNSTKLVHAPTDNFINAEYANVLLIVGGALQMYDGTAVTELGFHVYPENITATPQGSGGSLSAGVYQYIVEWQWTDNRGQIHRSAPSVAISKTCVANDSVLLSGPSLRLTSKSKVSIVIYRTAANGTLFRRITSSLAPTLNDPTTDSWSFTDTLSDASSLANELDYTVGGTLNNIAPPASAFMTTWNNRVVLGGLSDKLLLWYSQAVSPQAGAAAIPPQFCQELTIAVDPRGGPVTALGVLNQTLVIFKSGSIFVLSGNGPDSAGQNNDLGSPVMIASDVGCINPNTVVLTALGLLFQSARGIYLLDQALNLSYIGANVEGFNSLAITSSAQNAQDNQIIFCSQGNPGTALVYDYYFKQWSTWTNLSAADVVIYQNLITFVTPAGQVYQQNRSVFTDAGAPILLSFTLPNLSFAGIQGYQRVFRCWILGTYKSPHQLVANVAYDYSDSYTAQANLNALAGVPTWGSDIAWGAGSGWGLSQYWGGAVTPYHYRVDFAKQKCTAIRLQVSDAMSANYGEGYSISSIVFEVGALPGGQRLPASSQYGAS